MKAYLLLCFFLLFYSINSQTRENNRKKCEIARSVCNKKCNDVHLARLKNCHLVCDRNYYKCLALYGN